MNGRRLTSWLAGILLVSGCESVSVEVVPVARVDVQPGSAQLIEGESVTLTAVARSAEGSVLSGRGVSWTSDAPLVASVDGGGSVQGLAPGETSVHARVEGIDGSAQVTVLAAPTLEVSRSLISVTADEGGSAPQETVTVSNGGSGDLTGLTASVAYGAGAAVGWLTAGLSSTSAPATLTLAASAAGLSAGDYEATVTVRSPQRGGLEATVGVSFTVTTPPPSVVVDPDAVGLNVLVGTVGDVTQTVSVTNGGGGVLDGLTTAIEYVSGPSQGWLTATLAATEAPTTLELRASPLLLTAGTYRARVTVSSPEAPDASGTVEVELTVALPGVRVPTGEGDR